MLNCSKGESLPLKIRSIRTKLFTKHMQPTIYRETLQPTHMVNPPNILPNSLIESNYVIKKKFILEYALERIIT